MRHKDGQVSDDTDVALARVISKRVPLLKEKKLRELLSGDFISELGASLGQRVRITTPELALPSRPFAIALGPLQRIEQRIIIEPPGRMRTEFIELIFNRRFVLAKVFKSRAQQICFPQPRCFEVNPLPIDR
jgi:hypothetical protein